MDINNFCYEHITSKSYDKQADYLKENGFMVDAPEAENENKLADMWY